MSVRDNRFRSLDDCAGALSAEIADVLSAALKRHGCAAVALSGGRTPRHILPLLAKAPLAWERIAVTLTDERCVPADDPDSNARLVRENFLKHVRTAPAFHPLWFEGGDIRDACRRAGRALVRRALPLDAVYLGLGPDGHVASLFPSASWERLDGGICIEGRAPSPPHARISLSLPLILSAQTIFLQLSGADKEAVLTRARRAGPHPRLPVSLILHAGHPDVRVFLAP